MAALNTVHDIPMCSSVDNDSRDSLPYIHGLDMAAAEVPRACSGSGQSGSPTKCDPECLEEDAQPRAAADLDLDTSRVTVTARTRTARRAMKMSLSCNR